MKAKLVALLTSIAIISSSCLVFGADGNILYNSKEVKFEKMQNDITYPLEKKSLDNSLAMNNLKSFKGYKGQGEIHITSMDVLSVDVFVNGKKLDIQKALDNNGKSQKIDISKLTVNGINTVQVTNIKPSTATLNIKIPYPVVIEGTPEIVGMNSEKLNIIDLILEKEVEYGFPGGQLVVIKDGVMIKNSAYGNINAYEKDGSRIKNPIPVTTDTLYDLASNTKMYSVNYALQFLVSQGVISVNDKINSFFPEFKDEVNAPIKGKDTMTIQNILQHQAGFPPDPQYFNDTYDKDDGIVNGKNDLFSQTKALTEKMILNTPLSYEPGTQTKYSDVDYMLLGMIIEKVTNQDLDKFVEENIYKPLGLDRIVFNPLQKGFDIKDTAATELNGNSRDGAVSFTNNRNYTIQGEVHDEKAFYSMNGVSGHAGLFSNAQQLGKLAQVMLNKGGYGDTKLFDINTIDQFVKPKDTNVTYGLGWRREGDNGYSWGFGEQAPSSVYGHTGWTGTLSVIDPENDMIIIWLGNKKNSPVVDNTKDPNYFYGDHFLGGTYGAIPLFVYESLKDTNMESVDSLLSELVTNKLSIMQTNKVYQNVADDQSLLALIDIVVARAEITKNDKNISMAKEVISKLKDNTAKAKFTQRINKL